MEIERIQEIAEELCDELCEVPHRVLVLGFIRPSQHRLIDIWCDSLHPLPDSEDRRFACWGTSVDMSDTEEMVRYRIRAMFASDYGLHHIGMYEDAQPTVVDHPDEPPPY